VARSFAADYDNWMKKNQPYIWLKIEEARGYSVWIDLAHGKLAVTDVNNELLGYGRKEIIDDRFVVLDTDYYGTRQYLWFPDIQTN